MFLSIICDYGLLRYLMDLAISVGMWNRDFEGHALLRDIIIQLAEWIDIVSWMTIILQIETGKYDQILLELIIIAAFRKKVLP